MSTQALSTMPRQLKPAALCPQLLGLVILCCCLPLTATFTPISQPLSPPAHDPHLCRPLSMLSPSAPQLPSLQVGLRASTRVGHRTTPGIMMASDPPKGAESRAAVRRARIERAKAGTRKAQEAAKDAPPPLIDLSDPKAIPKLQKKLGQQTQTLLAAATLSSNQAADWLQGALNTTVGVVRDSLVGNASGPLEVRLLDQVQQMDRAVRKARDTLTRAQELQKDAEEALKSGDTERANSLTRQSIRLYDKTAKIADDMPSQILGSEDVEIVGAGNLFARAKTALADSTERLVVPTNVGSERVNSIFFFQQQRCYKGIKIVGNKGTPLRLSKGLKVALLETEFPLDYKIAEVEPEISDRGISYLEFVVENPGMGMMVGVVPNRQKENEKVMFSILDGSLWKGDQEITDGKQEDSSSTPATKDSSGPIALDAVLWILLRNLGFGRLARKLGLKQLEAMSAKSTGLIAGDKVGLLVDRNRRTMLCYVNGVQAPVIAKNLPGLDTGLHFAVELISPHSAIRIKPIN